MGNKFPIDVVELENGSELRKFSGWRSPRRVAVFYSIDLDGPRLDDMAEIRNSVGEEAAFS